MFRCLIHFTLYGEEESGENLRTDWYSLVSGEVIWERAALKKFQDIYIYNVTINIDVILRRKLTCLIHKKHDVTCAKWRSSRARQRT